jgi:hypothetical protein
MKKTVTLPDGTVEVLEGTPEEIAAHEKLTREKVVKEQRKKPDVLKGDEDDLAKKLQEIFDKMPQLPQYPQYPVQPWWPTERPIWIASCSRCSSYPCICQHWDLSPTIFCKTVTVTGNNTPGILPALTCSADHHHERVYDGCTANAVQTGWLCLGDRSSS